MTTTSPGFANPSVLVLGIAAAAAAAGSVMAAWYRSHATFAELLAAAVGWLAALALAEAACTTVAALPVSVVVHGHAWEQAVAGFVAGVGMGAWRTGAPGWRGRRGRPGVLIDALEARMFTRVSERRARSVRDEADALQRAGVEAHVVYRELALVVQLSDWAGSPVRAARRFDLDRALITGPSPSLVHEQLVALAYDWDMRATIACLIDRAVSEPAT